MSGYFEEVIIDLPFSKELGIEFCPEDFWLNVVAIMRFRGYTQEALAVRAGMSRPRLAYSVKNYPTPRFSTILKLANALEVDIQDICVEAFGYPSCLDIEEYFADEND